MYTIIWDRTKLVLFSQPGLGGVGSNMHVLYCLWTSSIKSSLQYLHICPVQWVWSFSFHLFYDSWFDVTCASLQVNNTQVVVFTILSHFTHRHLKPKHIQCVTQSTWDSFKLGLGKSLLCMKMRFLVFLATKNPSTSINKRPYTVYQAVSASSNLINKLPIL